MFFTRMFSSLHHARSRKSGSHVLATENAVHGVLVPSWLWITLTIGGLWAATPTQNLWAIETVTFKSSKDDLVNGVPKPTRTVEGEILIQAADGGLMLQSDDGRIWTIQPEQIVKRQEDDRALKPLSSAEMAKRMKQEMPPGFSVYKTAHYVIVHNTSEAYAKRVGLLFEQLYKGFYAFWKNQGWRLPDPEFPLVALVLADRDDFLKYATPQVGDTAQIVIGYYHLSSNRMTTFYMRNLERNVATIVHEATHQLAYNCGVQRRFADNPMWFSEGLAMFFESPDFKSASMWRGIGRVNQVNLRRWREYLAKRPQGSLLSLLSSDERFRDAEKAEFAYGESWALTYYLLKTRRKQYVEFMKNLSTGKPMVERSGRERVALFEKVFGESVAEIDKGLIDYMRKVK